MHTAPTGYYKFFDPITDERCKAPKYYLLGVEVDWDTYRKFMYDRTYTVASDLGQDLTCSLSTVLSYAAESHAQDYPTEAAAAKKIITQIHEELTRKDAKNLKTPKNACDFIAALNDIYTESRSKYDAIQKAYTAAQAKMDQAYKEMTDYSCQDKPLATAKYEAAKAEYLVADKERKSTYTELQRTYEQSVRELRTQFGAFLDDHYAASPDKLDAATMQLLEAGICSAAEMSHLADRHANNPTMLRIIGAYAERKRAVRNIPRSEYEILTTVQHKAAAAKDGSREMEIFDSAVGIAAYGLDRNYSHATNMHNSLVANAFDDFKQRMADVPNTPYTEMG